MLVFDLTYFIPLLQDFTYAVQSIRPSVSPDSLLHYSQWAEQFGVTR